MSDDQVDATPPESPESPDTEETLEDLAATLLHAPVATRPLRYPLQRTFVQRLALTILWYASLIGVLDLVVARIRGTQAKGPPLRERPTRWCYGAVMQIVASVFILYHGSILLVHNLPSQGLARGVQKTFNDKLDADRYFRATGNTQSWAMFAPNPHRSNIFMKVRVKDANGQVWDLKHDIWGVNRYPYLWYDRMGKINRRIIDAKGYRRHYAAWVCREWERTHDGEAAEEVQFVKMWTRIPPPEQVFQRAKGNIFRMGYEPWQLHLNERDEDEILCRTTQHAQLPNEIRERERYGLPPMPEGHFKAVSLRTWWDQKESKRRQEEREQQRVERAERLRAEREERMKLREQARIRTPAEGPADPSADPPDEPGEGEPDELELLDEDQDDRSGGGQ